MVRARCQVDNGCAIRIDRLLVTERHTTLMVAMREAIMHAPRQSESGHHWPPWPYLIDHVCRPVTHKRRQTPYGRSVLCRYTIVRGYGQRRRVDLPLAMRCPTPKRPTALSAICPYYHTKVTLVYLYHAGGKAQELIATL